MEKDVAIFFSTTKKNYSCVGGQVFKSQLLQKNKQAHLFGGYNQEALHLNDTIGGSARVGKSVDNVPYSPPPLSPSVFTTLQ